MRSAPQIVAAWVATLALVSACGGGSAGARPAPSTVSTAAPTTGSPALTSAITTFQSGRTKALADVAPVTRAAAVLDAADADATKGSLERGRSAIPGATGPVKAGTAALAAMGKDTTSYAAAVAALAASETTPGLSAGQRQSLTTLAGAANGEVTALRGFAASQSLGWAAYGQLQAALTLWLSRAVGGDYADMSTLAYSAAVAGSAYEALTHPLRSSLATERAGLATGTGALAAAQTATDTALDGARSAFG